MGSINLKKLFGHDACSMFIMPPSVEELERRLRGRGTDSEETILKRVAKAEFEISKAPEFDYTVVNDDLQVAIDEAKAIINKFLK
jgi:guanylate kinase